MKVSSLARRHGLSRGTVIHYDRLGLLKPTGRTRANYREYSEKDEARLEEICLLRKAGISLRDIARVLEGGEELLAPALEGRLRELDREMESLRVQQRLVANLLKRSPDLAHMPELDWAAWVSLVKAAGLTLEDLKAWHAHFERLSPEKHSRFLERLCIPDEERARLKRWGLPLPE